MTAAGLQILVTELGDETFIIAAIMAMRHPRLVVYVGAMTALVSMTVSWNTFYLWEFYHQHAVYCLYKVSKSALAQDVISSAN
jgi:putative Ca2+/H+ antiporter (TMEM165/GDT1 family)